jgi:ABC-2 type transport system ATP-binding protein
MNHAIETNNLSKYYGDVRAVEQLSLRVGEGEIYAFLGLNGAGKTTAIRLLLGMIKPTAGSASVLYTPVRLGAVEPWARVGYLVETPHAYPELTVRENLEVARRLHPGTPPKAIGDIIERLVLSAYADRRAGTLSLGNAQRLGLAKALLHNPRLLLLDEPANGLDPAGIVEIRELLLGLAREQGITVFMSSHILGEVSRLADRIGIIHQGRLIQELNVDELERNRQRRLVLKTRDIEQARLALVAAGLQAHIGNHGGSIALADAASIERPDDIASLLVKARTPPTQLMVEEEDLEEYFLRLVGVDGESNRGSAENAEIRKKA